jgi:ABC-type phosphonate transport system ATPase subunit
LVMTDMVVSKSPYVPMSRRPLPAQPMRHVRQRVHAGRIYPPVVEIEQRANRDGEENRVIVPFGFMQRLHVFRRDARRVAIHLVDEPEQRLVTVVQVRLLEVPQHAFDQLLVAQKFRRNCGVRLDSKRAVVAVGRIGRDELSDAWAEGRGPTKDFLRELRQVLRRPR